jgi:hypothetical protein
MACAWLRRRTAGSGELRRRTATPATSSALAMSEEHLRKRRARVGEYGEGSVAFYRRGRGGERDAREIMGRRRSSLAIDGVGFTEKVMEEKRLLWRSITQGEQRTVAAVFARVLGRHWACRVVPARARFLASRAGHADVASSCGFGRGGARARCRAPGTLASRHRGGSVAVGRAGRRSA